MIDMLPIPLRLARGGVLVDMAHALKLAVVAEGVETADVVAFLRAAACDEAQGYHFARPLTLAALRERLAADASSGP